MTAGAYLGLGRTELVLVRRQLRTIFQGLPGPVSWRGCAVRFHENVWPRGRETAFFLHNVPVTATTSDKHGRRRQSSQAARGQRKSLRTFFLFCFCVLFFFVVLCFYRSETSSMHFSCPTRSAWLRLPSPLSPPLVPSARCVVSLLSVV